MTDKSESENDKPVRDDKTDGEPDRSWGIRLADIDMALGERRRRMYEYLSP